MVSRLYAILSKVLRIPEDKITDAMTPNDVKTWDSMNALILVAELEGAFHIRFKSEDIVSVRCVGDIKQVLKKYGVSDNP